ncbi:MAG TPA: hypothetical protein VEH84_02210 [Alphaproteobacteria bacterium]|nr:hypothetical protein [Alphaproteobacteria bacterium]
MARLIRRTLRYVGLLLLTLVGLAAGLFAALPAIAGLFPVELDRVRLSDGRREVEMQGMMHIGSPRFYDAVAELVAARRREGWLVFYEGVRSDTADPQSAMAEIMARLGADIVPVEGEHPYLTLATFVGAELELQDNARLLGPPGPELRNVDVTMSALLAELPPAEPDGPAAPVSLAELRDAFADMPGWLQARLRAAARLGLGAAASGRFDAALPEAITARREALVADAVLAEPGRSVLILYGQVHLDPIRRRLEAADPAWRVTAESTVAPL